MDSSDGYEDMPPLVSDSSDDSDKSSEDVSEVRYSVGENDENSVPSLLESSGDDDDDDDDEYCHHCTCGYCHENGSDYGEDEDEDEDEEDYDDDENDTFDDGSSVSSETSSTSNGDIPALIPIFNPESQMYYCHICKHEITIQQNENGYPKCSVCQSSYVEMLGQGLHLFLEPIRNSGNATRAERIDSNASNRRRFNPTSGVVELASMRPSRVGIIVRRTGGRPVRGDVSENDPLAAARAGRTIQSFLGGVSQNPVVHSLVESIVGNGNRNRHGISRSLDELLSHIIMAVDSNAGTPPATQSTIDRLERETLTEHSDLLTSGEICSISLETFKTGDKIVKLPCGHKFIEEPIVTWLKSHDSCPTCRVRVGQ